MNPFKISFRNRVAALTLLLFFCQTCGNTFQARLAAAQPTPGTKTKKIHVALLRDVSGSMETDGRHQTTAEALKLAARLLDGTLTIVNFSDEAQASTYRLPADFSRVVEFVDATPTGGGTSFTKALKKVPATATAVLFLSDGAPTEEPSEVLESLKHISCPIHTVASDSEAEGLLRKMAAATKGGFYRARDAEELADAFLGIMSQVTKMRTIESTGSPVNLGHTVGKLLCIGVNAPPNLQVMGLSSPLSEFSTENVFRLPGADLFVATETLPTSREVVVTLGTPSRGGPTSLIVATLEQAELDVAIQRTKDAKLVARAKVICNNPLVDEQPVKTQFTLVGEDGDVQQVVAGKVVGDEVVAELDAPEGSYNIRVETIDAKNGKRTSSLAVAGTETLPLAPSPKEPVSLVTAPTAPKTIALTEDCVDLVIVAHRTTGSVVLGQSGQAHGTTGLTGIDRPSLEVVRHSIDPRVFAALGGSSLLHARWFRADGRIENTPLRLEGNRYVTDPVEVAWEGRVVCELSLGTSESTSPLKVEAIFLPVNLSLRDITTHAVPSAVPQGTMMRPQFEIDVQVGGRPATPTELAEVLAVESPSLRMTAQDHMAADLYSTEFEVDELGRFYTQWVIASAGTVNMRATLKGQKSGRVWANVQWPTFRVEPSPVEVSLCRFEDGVRLPAEHVKCPSWLPRIFKKPDMGHFYTVGLKADHQTPFFIESVRLTNRLAKFDPELNTYLIPVDELDHATCIVNLGTVGSTGLPSEGCRIPVKTLLGSPNTTVIRYGRLVTAVTLALLSPLVLLLGRRFIVTRRLSFLGTEATLIDNATYQQSPLVSRGRLWASTTIYVCCKSGGYHLAYPGQLLKGSRVVGRLRQRADGTVQFQAVEDLLDLQARKKRVLEVGDSEVRLDDTTTISVDVGRE